MLIQQIALATWDSPDAMFSGVWPPFPELQHPTTSTKMFRISLVAVLLLVSAVGNTQARPDQASLADKSAAVSKPSGEYDPLLDLPPLRPDKISLIGGTVTRLDRVQDQLILQPFGDKKQMRLAFDVRTRFYRDGQRTSGREINQGQRVYADTMLDGTRLFAKTIWINSGSPSGSSRGQVLEFDSQSGIVTVRDELSAEPMKFHVDQKTVVRQNNASRTIADLKSGSLVSLSFGPDQRRSGNVREIEILAQPGSMFSFFGRVTYMDLSKKMIAVANEVDSKTYDIQLEALPGSSLRSVRQGSLVTVYAVFDGKHYVARNIEPAANSEAANQ
jgi:hypothetical protein